MRSSNVMAHRMWWQSALGLAYAGVAVLLVHSQAAAYRGALLARRELARQVPVAAPSLVEHPPLREPPPVITAAPEPPPNPTPKVEPPAVVVTRPMPMPMPTPAPTPPPPPPLAKPKVEAEVASVVVPDLDKLSTAEETKLGNLLHMLILSNHGVDEDGPYQRSITEAVRPMLERRQRKDLEITITVLDSNEINAFSHLGGYIYVTRGLFHFAATPEEFCFVVGHELAHLDKRDSQRIIAGASGGGTLQALYHQIAAGFPKAEEFAADAWAADQMRALGQSDREILMFLRKFVPKSEEKGFRNGGKTPKSPPSAPVQEIDNHFRSQPAAWERLERLKSRLKVPSSNGTVR